MRLNLNVACRHYKGCLFACRTCKLNRNPCRFASPFVKDFSRRSRVCGYGHGFACFCRWYVFRAVHNNYIILSNSQVSCLKGYAICRHIELDFRFGQVHTRRVKSRNFPLVEFHIGIRLVCFDFYFRLIGCHIMSCRSVCDGYAIFSVLENGAQANVAVRHFKRYRFFRYVRNGNAPIYPFFQRLARRLVDRYSDGIACSMFCNDCTGAVFHGNLVKSDFHLKSSACFIIVRFLNANEICALSKSCRFTVRAIYWICKQRIDVIFHLISRSRYFAVTSTIGCRAITY